MSAISWDLPSTCIDPGMGTSIVPGPGPTSTSTPWSWDTAPVCDGGWGPDLGPEVCGGGWGLDLGPEVCGGDWGPGPSGTEVSPLLDAVPGLGDLFADPEAGPESTEQMPDYQYAAAAPTNGREEMSQPGWRGGMYRALHKLNDGIDWAFGGIDSVFGL